MFKLLAISQWHVAPGIHQGTLVKGWVEEKANYNLAFIREIVLPYTLPGRVLGSHWTTLWESLKPTQQMFWVPTVLYQTARRAFIAQVYSYVCLVLSKKSGWKCSCGFMDLGGLWRAWGGGKMAWAGSWHWTRDQKLSKELERSRRPGWSCAT